MKYSLNVGVNKFLPNIFGANSNLNGCVNDCNYYANIAKSFGYQVTRLVDESCKKEDFIKNLREMAQKAVSKDSVFITISSHGTLSYLDGNRMTGVCFHDGILWDFEYVKLLSEFKKGVNIFYLSDTCHAEGNFRSSLTNTEKLTNLMARPKFLDFSQIRNIEKPIVVEDKKTKIVANVIAYASSKEIQYSYDVFSDGTYGGYFTKKFTESFLKFPKLNYFQFFTAVKSIMKDFPQTPVFQYVNGKTNAFTFQKILQ